MTIDELHEILDSDRKINMREFREILYEMMQDCINEQIKILNGPSDPIKYSFYNGEKNGFQLVLDLSTHIICENIKREVE